MKLNTLLHSDLAKVLVSLVPGGGITKTAIEAVLMLTKDGVAPDGASSNPTLVTMAAAAAVEKITSKLESRKETDGQAAEPAQKTSGVSQIKTRSGFRFGRKSQAELVGVLPELVSVVDRALMLSKQDFMIFDGLRTPEEQRILMKNGKSKTMNSMHLKQADGFSHAVDCVPVVGTIPKWDWELIFPVVLAMDQAATQFGVANRIVWGGAWDRRLSDFGGNTDAYREEIKAYANRHPGTDFIDGPHFEWR